MRYRLFSFVFLMALLLGVVSCGDDDGDKADARSDTSATDTSATDTSATDTSATDTSGTDVSPADTSGTDTSGTDTSGTDTSSPADTIQDSSTLADVTEEDAIRALVKVPTVHTLECVDSMTGEAYTGEEPDVAYVCSTTYGGTESVIYFHARPLNCGGYGSLKEFVVEGAWLASEGVLSSVSIEYDWGGGHHNDSISVEVGELRWYIYHSSFGFGWRACNAPDCLQIYDGTTMMEDGCEPDRALPVVCVEVGADGSVPELVDTFEVCEGDPDP